MREEGRALPVGRQTPWWCVTNCFGNERGVNAGEIMGRKQRLMVHFTHSAGDALLMDSPDPEALRVVELPGRRSAIT